MIKCSQCGRNYNSDNGMTCEVCGKYFCNFCLDFLLENIQAGELTITMCEQCNSAEVTIEEVIETYQIFSMTLWNWRRREVLEEMEISVAEDRFLKALMRRIRLRMIEFESMFSE